METEISVLEKELIERVPIEELIFHLTEENFEDAKSQIQKYLFNKTWLQNLITAAGVRCTFKWKLLGDLFALTGKPVIQFDEDFNFSCYLYARGLITENDFGKYGPPDKEELSTISEYEEPIKENTLKYFIYMDNVQSFVSYIITHEVDIKKENRIRINDQRFSCLTHLVCYCGSINIIKYLISNNVEITKTSICYSVLGGSEELIQFFAQKGYSFDNTMEFAVEGHFNRVAKWLYENYKQFIDFPVCAAFMNTEMFLYFINDQGMYIDIQDVFCKTCLHYSVEHDDIVLTKYLLSRGISKNLKDRKDRTAIKYAKSNDIRELLQ